MGTCFLPQDIQCAGAVSRDGGMCFGMKDIGCVAGLSCSELLVVPGPAETVHAELQVNNVNVLKRMQSQPWLESRQPDAWFGGLLLHA